MQNQNKKNHARYRDWILLIVIVLFMGGVWLFNKYAQHTSSSNVMNPFCDKNHFYKPVERPQFVWNGGGVVTLWFDDILESQYTIAAPMLRKAGMVGAIAATTGFACGSGFMNWDQVRQLQAEGWEISDHSIHHYCDINAYTPAVIQDEVVKSKEILENKGFYVPQFVMPCGPEASKVPSVMSVVVQNYGSYRNAGNVGSDVNSLPVSNPYNIVALTLRSDTTQQEVKKWLNEAKAQKGWVILSMHRIDANDEYAITTKMLQAIIDMIKDSGLQVALPQEVLQIGEKSSPITPAQ